MLSRTIYVLYCVAVFTSAFLLFQVQPLIARMILPWFGGAASVWTTCMLFFQVVLVVGYGYAHLIARFPLRIQAMIHCSLLVATCLSLPISPSDVWRPESGESPVSSILTVLLVSVGLPYVMLAASGPAIQSWFAATISDRSPYRLYALSNIGSLAGLLTYPIVFEPNLTLAAQDYGWCGLFVLFVACTAAVLWSIRQHSAQFAVDGSGQVAGAQVPRRQWLTWLMLPAMASAALLAVTNHITQDLAAIPFLWILPLSLYLISFIQCFAGSKYYSRAGNSAGVILATIFISICSGSDYIGEYYPALRGLLESAGLGVFITGWLVLLYFVCVLCHGELEASKPPPEKLTGFYLWISVGGAVGGFLITIVCPLIFNDYYEVGLLLVIGYAAAVWIIGSSPSLDLAGSIFARKLVAGLIGVAGLFVVVAASLDLLITNDMEKSRNFYGVLKVKLYDPPGILLQHGTTRHGFQSTDKKLRFEPTTYYSRQNGIGVALDHFPRSERHGLDVVVVGLGAGTLAAYGQEGDQYTFYDINPAVDRVAKQWFSYLKDSAAETKTVIRDGRSALESEPADAADMIVLDAFSGDAIPMHLLTTEAFEIYLRHLREDGVLAIHASNNYIDLSPVVARLAAEHRIPCWEFKTTGNETHKNVHVAAVWLILTKNEGLSGDSVFSDSGRKMPQSGSVLNTPLWTDQYTSILPFLR